MVDILDPKVIRDSLIDMLKAEESRIVLAGLASASDMKTILSDVCSKIIAAGTENKSYEDTIEDLAFLHLHLASIKLPGDFKKVSEDLRSSFYITAQK